jgi:hypothetical protein
VVGAEGEPWSASLAGCPDWQPRDPLADRELLENLKALRKLGHRPLPTTEDGQLTAEAAGLAAALRGLAVEVGDRLTDALLSPAAREALVYAVHSGLTGDPPLLHLQVRSSGTGEAAERLADRALALPWELLRLDGCFPIEEGTLDLAREALVPGTPGLTAPNQP